MRRSLAGSAGCVGLDEGVAPAVAVGVEDQRRPALRGAGRRRCGRTPSCRASRPPAAAAGPQDVVRVELQVVGRVAGVDEGVLAGLRLVDRRGGARRASLGKALADGWPEPGLAEGRVVGRAHASRSARPGPAGPASGCGCWPWLSQIASLAPIGGGLRRPGPGRAIGVFGSRTGSSELGGGVGLAGRGSA